MIASNFDNFDNADIAAVQQQNLQQAEPLVKMLDAYNCCEPPACFTAAEYQRMQHWHL